MKIGNLNLPNPNAVLYKDMQQKTKRVKLALTVFLCNLALALISLTVLVVMTVNSIDDGGINYSTLTTLFVVLASFEAGFICLLTPVLTAGSITMEREKQTFDVLLSTRLTPWQIITGKYWASILQILLLIISGLPIYSLVFIYGGVSFFQALAVMITIIVVSMFIASLGILASATRQKTIAANVTTFAMMALFFVGTIFVVLITAGIADAINSSNNYNGIYTNYTVGPFAFILYMNPGALIIDVFFNVFGVSFLGIDFGMGELIADITNFSANNFFLKYWSIISIIVLLALSYLFLRLAAKAIDPLKARRFVYGKGFKVKAGTVRVHPNSSKTP